MSQSWCQERGLCQCWHSYLPYIVFTLRRSVVDGSCNRGPFLALARIRSMETASAFLFCTFHSPLLHKTLSNTDSQKRAERAYSHRETQPRQPSSLILSAIRPCSCTPLSQMGNHSWPTFQFLNQDDHQHVLHTTPREIQPELVLASFPSTTLFRLSTALHSLLWPSFQRESLSKSRNVRSKNLT